MSTVAVVGAGGVGSYFAARAALAGADVTLCVRSPRPEFVIRSGGEELRPDVRTVTDPADVGPVDWVFLATKAHQTDGAADWLRALDGPPLVMLQNGVRLPERVRGRWSGEVLPAVVYCAVEMISPGVVEHYSYGWFTVQQGETAQRLADVFGPGQQEVHQTRDVVRTGWEKLISNASGNSITALTCRRVEVLHEPSMQDLAVTVMRESVAVARAEGVTLDDGIAEDVLDRMLQMPKDQGSSMLYDRLGGVELEHEALVGAVVAIGAEHGVPTPASTTLLALLRAVSGRPAVAG